MQDGQLDRWPFHISYLLKSSIPDPAQPGSVRSQDPPNPMVTSMPLFTSERERRLWLCSLAVVVAIYSTLGLAGTLAEVLRERNLLPASLLFLLFLLVAAIVGSGLKRRPARREIWVALGITAVYGLAVLRMSGSPEERTHLFEYGIVAVLIYHALSERAHNGRRVRAPAAVALVVTALLGWLDEGIQALLPNRVYDAFDVFVNALSALMAMAASLAIAWACRRIGARPGSGCRPTSPRTAPQPSPGVVSRYTTTVSTSRSSACTPSQ